MYFESALYRLVRESGYAAAMLKASGDIGENYSRSYNVWDIACGLLLAEVEDKDEANRFIKATWNPTDIERKDIII